MKATTGICEKVFKWNILPDNCASLIASECPSTLYFNLIVQGFSPLQLNFVAVHHQV